MKKQLRFNVIDAILICLVIMLMAALYGFFFNGKNLIDFSQQDRVQFLIRVDKIPSVHSGLIENGDRIYLAGSDKSIGFVKSAVYNRASISESTDNNGNADIRFYPDLQDIIITVECDAKIKDGNIKIDGHTLNDGEFIDFYVSNYAATGKLTDIEVLS